MLATRSIEARARQEGRASLYDWIVYKRGSKARERKGEERKHCSKLYTILWLRNGNLPLRDGKLRQSDGNLPVLFSTSAVTLPPPLKKPCWNYKVIRSQRRCLEGLFDDRDDADDEY